VKKQGIVGSICPAQLDDPSNKAYGYRPAIGALVEQLKKRILSQCLPRPVSTQPDGSVACLVLEARKVEPAEVATCCEGLPARSNVTAEHQAEADKFLTDNASVGWNCVCELDQLVGKDLTVCQTDTSLSPVNASGEPVDGWCYVDPGANPPVGDPALVATCNATERRKIRFVGAGQPMDNAVTVMTCASEQ
jgi:hypothetical protein